MQLENSSMENTTIHGDEDSFYSCEEKLKLLNANYEDTSVDRLFEDEKNIAKFYEFLQQLQGIVWQKRQKFGRRNYILRLAQANQNADELSEPTVKKQRCEETLVKMGYDYENENTGFVEKRTTTPNVGE